MLRLGTFGLVQLMFVAIVFGQGEPGGGGGPGDPGGNKSSLCFTGL